MNERHPPDWLPPGAEELLSNWPDHQRSDKDFERMARAIEARLATEGSINRSENTELGSELAGRTDDESLDSTGADADPPASSEQLSPRALADAKNPKQDSDDWLFRPPLPLASGERRHAPGSPAKSGTELSLKEIAQAALESAPAAAARPPLRSHVQRRTSREEATAARGNTSDRQSQINLVSRRSPVRPAVQTLQARGAETTAPNVVAKSNIVSMPSVVASEQPSTAVSSSERGDSNVSPEQPRQSSRAPAWWLWGSVAAAACVGALFVKGFDTQPTVATAPTVTVIHQITAAPPSADVSDTESETPTSPPAAVAKLEQQPEATSLEDLPMEKPRAVARAVRTKPQPSAASEGDAEGTGAPEPEIAEPQLIPAARPGALPERPSIGAAQGAIGAKLGPARACLAGTYQPSKASVVFGSDGRVRSVQVSGPAQGTPAEPCIIKAMSSARLQPFADESFTIRTTVRP